jgi:ribosomal-protein-alanine N-acetyltransferase
MPSGVILTERLELLPATPGLLSAALAGAPALAAALRAEVPPTWPPEYLDDDALRFTLARLAERPAHVGWWMHFLLTRDAPRTLIGSGGYKGPPADGTAEVGYGIVSDRRRRGFASEATRALVTRAFADPDVRRVIAETLPELAGSIRVLEKCGFRLTGAGSEPGVIRYELTRDEHARSVPLAASRQHAPPG